MKQSAAAKDVGGRSLVGVDEAFQALPPLGSTEYIARIQATPTNALPPEALVRAFRQLPADSLAATATLGRLFRKSGRRWDYFGPLLRHARWLKEICGLDEYEDLLQDAFCRILQVLPTPRGAFAEKAWHTYCRNGLIEAWRERYGRRGERLPSEELLEYGDDSETRDLSAFEDVVAPWHSVTRPTQVEKIEEIARLVVSEIGDEFIREVARAAWFANERPAVSGIDRPEKANQPLTSKFKHVSRHQITRALRHADAQLIAGLLNSKELVLTPELEDFIQGLRRRNHANRQPEQK